MQEKEIYSAGAALVPPSIILAGAVEVASAKECYLAKCTERVGIEALKSS